MGTAAKGTVRGQYWMSMQRVCDVLDCSEWTVRRMVHNDELPAYRRSATAPMRFRASDVDALMRPASEFEAAGPSRSRHG